MDDMGLTPEARSGLAEVISHHPQVERITCGHLHRMITRRFAGTVAATAPSVCHAVAMDLRPGASGGWTYEPPALTVHSWAAVKGLVTHQLAIGLYEVRPFAEY
jgi:hypothetical protein